MRGKNQTRPSDYPMLMLKELVKVYDDEKNVEIRKKGAGLLKIARLAGMSNKYISGDISDQELHDYAHQLEKNGYVYESDYADHEPWYKPTEEGCRYAYFLMRPWYRKAWDALKGDIRTIVISVISAIIITVVTTLILNAIGW